MASHGGGHPGRVRRIRRERLVWSEGGRSFNFESAQDGRSACLCVDGRAQLDLSFLEWDRLLDAVLVPDQAPIVPRQRTGRAGANWTPQEDDKLVSFFRAGRLPETIGFELARSRGAVVSRLERLGLVARGVMRPDFAAAHRQWASEQHHEPDVQGRDAMEQTR